MSKQTRTRYRTMKHDIAISARAEGTSQSMMATVNSWNLEYSGIRETQVVVAIAPAIMQF